MQSSSGFFGFSLQHMHTGAYGGGEAQAALIYWRKYNFKPIPPPATLQFFRRNISSSRAIRTDCQLLLDPK